MSSIRDSLTKALEQAGEGSLSPMTVSQLAKEVGVSRSTIYKYYPEIILKLKRLSGEVIDNSYINSHLKKTLSSNQLKEGKKTIGALVKVCSDLLIEMDQLKSRHRDDIDSRDLKIAHLQGKIDKYLRVKSIT